MQLISIHLFEQSFVNPLTEITDTAMVYLSIDHELKRYTVEPRKPVVGQMDYHMMRSQNYASIDEVAFQFKDIGTDFNRHLATLSCIYRAMIFACEELAIAKPTEIYVAKQLFIIDPPS